jgi:uncharacterized protein YifN (PemK superfamily)
MPIQEHPPMGTVVLCDFSGGFREPEMVKRRPVIVLSPRIRARAPVCTVVALSRTVPAPIMSYHARIDLRPALPLPWQSDDIWVKGDMINTVGFHRLDLFRLGKDVEGARKYLLDPLEEAIMAEVHGCVLAGLGLNRLTRHLTEPT